MKDKPKKCKWCDKSINPKQKLVEVNLYIGKVKRNGEKRLRQSQWIFHAKCFESCTGVPILPQEIKMVAKIPSVLKKNEFKNPETKIGENGSTTMAPNLP